MGGSADAGLKNLISQNPELKTFSSIPSLLKEKSDKIKNRGHFGSTLLSSSKTLLNLLGTDK